MIRPIHLFYLIALSYIFLSSCESKKEDNCYEKEAEFIYGALILSQSQDSLKNIGVDFKKIKEITGINSDSIIIFLNKSIRNNPENGKKLYQAIDKIVSDTSNSKN